MGKPLGKLIGAWVPQSVIDRLDAAVKATGSSSRSNLLQYIITSWLDSQGF